MGTSGNPAKRASDVADFKKRKTGTFELPSGLVMRLKNPGGMRLFLSEGMIPNSLMGTVQASLDKGKPMNEKDFVKDGKVDEAIVDDMMNLLDNILIKCAVSPRVHPVPTEEDLRVWNAELEEGEPRLTDPEELRDDEQLYVDEVDETDKMFIFQWVTGGTTDLEQFRAGFDQNVASLVGEPEVAVPTKRPSRARRG